MEKQKSSISDNHNFTIPSAGIPFRVALVNMPFSSIWRPSIQLGTLKAITEQQSIPVDTYHLNLDLAKIVGVDTYEALAEFRGRQIGEWLFSLSAFEETAPDVNDLFLTRFRQDISAILSTQNPDDLLNRLRRSVLPHYLYRITHGINWRRYTVVGLTCTYQQTTASLALARFLKNTYPHIVTVFGGANFDGEMGLELLTTSSSVDYIVQGEGEISFPSFLRAIRDGKDPASTQGVRAAHLDVDLAPQPSSTLEELDLLPIPDYREYFDRCDLLGLSDLIRKHGRIPFESSRGCWWGQKYHCVFCGLNGTSMRFRQKSSDRVLSELEYLGSRYDMKRFQAVDNILSPRYFESVFPKLATNNSRYDIFYELKANVSKEQLKLLSRSGVSSVQPGIESLSDHVLALMKKGTTALQNINTLRWCTHYGLNVFWNLLWGFPGEVAQDYFDQLRVLPLVSHLAPPQSGGRVRMERFSPLHSDHETLVGKTIAPEASYDYVYPGHVNKAALAYFFEFEFDGFEQELADLVAKQVIEWQNAWKVGRPRLEYECKTGCLELLDSRFPGVPTQQITYTQEWLVIYELFAEKPTTKEFATSRLIGVHSEAEIAGALREFCTDRVMLTDGLRYLALALPAQHLDGRRDSATAS